MYWADHLLTVAFTDTSRNAHFLGFYRQRERQGTKFNNFCLPSRLKVLPFSIREPLVQSQSGIFIDDLKQKN